MKVQLRPANVCEFSGLTIENSILSIGVVPDIGGRVMSLKLAGREQLWQNKELFGRLFSAADHAGNGTIAAWKNYGGAKTWPAPQGWKSDEEWHGPPDPVLDGGPYRVIEGASDERLASVTLRSEPDPLTGIQITRTLRLAQGSSRVSVTLTFSNRSERPRRWSIWDIVQHDAELVRSDGSPTHNAQCVVTAPLNPKSRYARGYHVMFGDDDNPQWQTRQGLLRAPYQYRIGKVGLDVCDGWVALTDCKRGQAFVTRFDHQPGLAYPDNGSSVECWTVGSGELPGLDLNYDGSGIYYIETEVLSPLLELEPGASRSFSIEWCLCTLSDAVSSVSVAGCAARPLSVARENGDIRLSGSFGVFENGEIVARLLDASGDELSRCSFGSAHPERCFELNASLAAGHAHRVELCTVAHTDARERRLALVELP